MVKYVSQVNFSVNHDDINTFITKLKVNNVECFMNLKMEFLGCNVE